MKKGDIRVLLVGESTSSFLHLKKSLGRRQCRIRTASSYEEAHRLVGKEIPDIVLSAIPPRPGAISSMTERLTGTAASFYYAYRVEDGYWWLPALQHGQRCFGAPAMRSREFTRLFDRVVAEIREFRIVRRKPDPARPAHPAKARRPILLAYEEAAG